MQGPKRLGQIPLDNVTKLDTLKPITPLVFYMVGKAQGDRFVNKTKNLDLKILLAPTSTLSKLLILVTPLFNGLNLTHKELGKINK
jgi:hypothetical protein